MSNDLKLWIRDTIERTASTWLQSFIGLILVERTDLFGSGIDLGYLKTAGISATIAAFAVLKAAVAAKFPAISPASLAKAPAGQ